ncbi:hypothetical protein OSTOST_21059 [Ostertagia ostertagi]
MAHDTTPCSLDILSLTSYTELILTLPQRHIVLALHGSMALGVCWCVPQYYMDGMGNSYNCDYTLFDAFYSPRTRSFTAGSQRWPDVFVLIGIWQYFITGCPPNNSLQMWAAAAEQVLFEMGVGTGALFSIAAYSRFRNNVYRDAALLVTMNVLTSVLVGMVLFSFLGLLSISSGKEISTLTSHDPFYMVFTVIPSMTKLMRWGPLWMSILFATIVFTGGGFFLFHSMDNLIAKLPTLILSFLVLISICYLYLVLMITHAIKHELPLFFGSHVPIGSEYVAWTLVNAPICAVLIGAVIATVKIRQSGKGTYFAFYNESLSSRLSHHYSTAPLGIKNTLRHSSLTRLLPHLLTKLHPDAKTPTCTSIRHLEVPQFVQVSSQSLTAMAGEVVDYETGRKPYRLIRPPHKKSFPTSLTSQGTLNLFGSPPVSNGFMISDATTIRTPMTNRKDGNQEKRDPPSPPPPMHEVRLETLPRKFAKSEPPLKISSGSDLVVPPSPPAPRVSPSRSEPPGLSTDRPSSSIRSKSETNDELSDSDEDSGWCTVYRMNSAISRVLVPSPVTSTKESE